MTETNLKFEELLRLGGQVLEISEEGRTTSVPVNKFLATLGEEEKPVLDNNIELIALFLPNSNKLHGLFAKNKNEEKIFKIFHRAIKVQ